MSRWTTNACYECADLKLILVAIYTNFGTDVVDAMGIEQADSYVAAPVGGKLVLRFSNVCDTGSKEPEFR